MWQQVYTPLSNIYFSALLAALPVLFFFVTLMVFKLKGYLSALVAFVVAVIVCHAGFNMPAELIFSSAVYGILGCLWPVTYIIIMAVWLYKLVIQSGKFDIIRDSIAAISADQRIQVILIAFCFCAFLEGVAGFGVPIAICTALLVQLGFRPLKAAALCLTANAASGAYGAIGIPVLIGAQQGGVDLYQLSLMMITIIQLPAAMIPMLLLFITDGVRGIKQTWPVLILTGLLFSGTQAITLYFIGPELTDIIAPLVSMIALAVFMRIWQPSFIYREQSTEILPVRRWPLISVLNAWLPFYILTVVILVWSLPQFKAVFEHGNILSFSMIKWQLPFLHMQIMELPPIATEARLISAVWNLDIIRNPGTAIFFTVLMTVWLSPALSMSSAFFQLLVCLKGLRNPLVMVSLIMAVAGMAKYSGASAAIALMLAKSGKMFPLVSPVIGWLGGVMTGSVVNSNILFATIQSVTAAQIHVSSVLMVAGNTCGAVMAKLISPSSVAIAAASVGQSGNESEIMRMTMKYSILLLLYICFCTFLLS